MIAGFGFQNSATEKSFNDLKSKFMLRHNISFVATTSEKSKTKAFVDFARNNNFKIISVSHKDLIGIKTPTKSQNSKKYKDIDCFCEAVALKTAGENSKIIQKREVSDDRLATIAIAEYE